ncbi:MAG: penicillin-binding protein 2 [Rickettsiales bacterium]|jgi:penicillin-binding protein 2|nr:penicillin-binding protein 2 [Rickettsiales bacterium]
MIDSYQKILFDRRAALMITGAGVLTSMLVLQMLHLQIFNRNKYRKLSQNNIYRVKVEIPRRGIIYARGEVELARDEQVYRLYIIPKDLADFDSALDFLTKSLGLNEKNLARIRNKRQKQRDFQPILIREKLNWQKMAELSALNIPGIHIEQGYARRYPLGEMAAHAIGYLSEPKDSVIPFFKTGRSGLERMYNSPLMGKAGQIINISNAEGKIIGEDPDQGFPATPGMPLNTTLIKEVQEKLEQELHKLQSGCGVAMDAETGDVFAIASLPSFNADLFGLEDGEEYIDELNANPMKPFMNKVLDGLYPPGSIFKIVVALAGLETGALKPTDKIICRGEWKYGNHLYHCWEKRGHGPTDLVGALKRSCDIYFYQMSLKIGIEAISSMAQKLGLGKKSFDNYDESEKAGIVPSREWKEANIGVPWVHGDTIITAIGQGFVLANCMQLAVMLGAAITNYRVKPRLTYDKKIVREFVGLAPQNISELSRGLQSVLEKGGTAAGSYINVNGKTMGGKTGTSQVRRISLEERAAGIRKDSELPWELRNHGLFVGYAPASNPKYIVAVVAEHAGGSSIVARAASAVMKELLNVEIQDG